jgi:sugar lactone lactonase YvrE
VKPPKTSLEGTRMAGLLTKWQAVLSLFCATAAHGQFTIQTVAGGGPNDVLAVTYGIGPMKSVAIGPAGELFVAAGNIGENRIYRITLADGKLFVHAGSGRGFGESAGDGARAIDAAMSYPTGLAFDSSGHLYFADPETNRVRRVDRFTGIITTVAGTGTRSSTGDGGPAVNATVATPVGLAFDTAGFLYIAEQTGRRIRRIAPDTKIISTVAGNGQDADSGDGQAASQASFRKIEDVAVDAAGNIYVSDSRTHRVRKIAAMSGIITAFACSGVAGYTGDTLAAISAQCNEPKGLFADLSGNVWIADSGNNRIRRVNPSGVIASVAGGGPTLGDGGVATSARLSTPSDIWVDIAGNLFIADMFNGRARKVDAVSNIISTMAGSGEGFPARGGGDGLPGLGAWMFAPASTARDSAGNVFIADAGDRKLRKLDATTGRMSTVAGTGAAGFSGDGGPATAAALDEPSGVVLDGAGNIYISDTNNHRIRKVAVGTNTITTIAGIGSGYSGDDALAVNARLFLPQRMTFDSQGNLYVADTGNRRIRRIDAAGVITTVAGNGTEECTGNGGAATAAAFRSPVSVAVAPNGDLFIADRDCHQVRVVTRSTGAINVLAGVGGAGFSGDGGPSVQAALRSPMSVSLDAAGNLLLADAGNDRVRRVDAASHVITTIAGTGVRGFGGDGGSSTLARFDSPSDVQVDTTGQVRVVDRGNRRVRLLIPACTFSLTPPVSDAPINGGDASVAVTVTAGSGCSWVSQSEVEWISIISGATGLNNGTVTYRVSANPGPPRSGNLQIAGKTFRVDQAGCGYAISPASFNLDWTFHRNREFTLATGAGCSWSARSSADWLQVFPLNGTAGGKVFYTLHPNFRTQQRVGTITVGGQVFTVTQAANTYPERNARIVNLLYYSFLNRLPSAAEVALQKRELDMGVSPADLARRFLDTPEFSLAGRWVAGLYVGILNRDAEFGGWLFQRTELIGANIGPVQLVGNFVNSAEFRLQHENLTDEDFVRVMYRQILGREPTQSEVDFQLVNMTSRADLAYRFFQSDEFKRGTNSRLLAFLAYATLLLRDPNAATERTPTINELNSGRTILEIMDRIVKSQEFGNSIS